MSEVSHFIYNNNGIHVNFIIIFLFNRTFITHYFHLTNLFKTIQNIGKKER